VLGQRLYLRTAVAIVLVVVASAGTTLEAGRSAAGRDDARPHRPAASEPTPLG
jgi:hypothetical protein